MKRAGLFKLGKYILIIGALFCVPAYCVGSSVSEFSELEKHYQALSSEQYEEIIVAALEAQALWLEARNEAGAQHHPRSFYGDDVPEPLRFLDPRSVSFSERQVRITFASSFRMNASLRIDTAEPDQITMTGIFGEPETHPPEVLYIRPLP